MKLANIPKNMSSSVRAFGSGLGRKSRQQKKSKAKTPELTVDSSDEEWAAAVKAAIDEYERKEVGHSPWQLLDHLYLANGLSAQSRPTILENGITNVLNLAADEIEIPVFYEFKDIKTERISAKDELGYDMLQHHEAAFEYIESVRKAGGKVMVHCMAGSNRSGLMVMTYLLEHLQKPLLEVLGDALSKRGMFLSNKDFRMQLVQFAREKNLLVASNGVEKQV